MYKDYFYKRRGMTWIKKFNVQQDKRFNTIDSPCISLIKVTSKHSLSGNYSTSHIKISSSSFLCKKYLAFDLYNSSMQIFTSTLNFRYYIYIYNL